MPGDNLMLTDLPRGVRNNNPRQYPPHRHPLAGRGGGRRRRLRGVRYPCRWYPRLGQDPAGLSGQARAHDPARPDQPLGAPRRERHRRLCRSRRRPARRRSWRADQPATSRRPWLGWWRRSSLTKTRATPIPPARWRAGVAMALGLTAEGIAMLAFLSPRHERQRFLAGAA